jgi:hypothetical protein
MPRSFVGDYQRLQKKKGPVDLIDCRQKQSGNMPAVQGQLLGTVLVTMIRGWISTHGLVRTRTMQRIRLEKRRPILGGFMTCLVMFGSGVSTGMDNTHNKKLPILSDQMRARSGSAEAGLGLATFRNASPHFGWDSAQ